MPRQGPGGGFDNDLTKVDAKWPDCRCKRGSERCCLGFRSELSASGYGRAEGRPLGMGRHNRRRRRCRAVLKALQPVEYDGDHEQGEDERYQQGSLADQIAGLRPKEQNVSENPGRLMLPLRVTLGAMMCAGSRPLESDSRDCCPAHWRDRSSPVEEGRRPASHREEAFGGGMRNDAASRLMTPRNAVSDSQRVHSRMRRLIGLGLSIESVAHSISTAAPQLVDGLPPPSARLSTSIPRIT